MSEQILMDTIVHMFNGIFENRERFIKTLTENIETIILQKPNIKEIEALDQRIDELKEELKNLIRFQVNNTIDSEVYSEEYNRLSEELQKVWMAERSELDNISELKDRLKERFDEILEVIDSRESLLDEFDEQIFNALVEKIEIVTPTHFVFVLKSGMRVEEVIEGN